MSDRIHALTVTLEHDMADTFALDTMAAIQQIKGVIAVEPQVADSHWHSAVARARAEFSNKLWDVLYPKTQE